MKQYTCIVQDKKLACSELMKDLSHEGLQGVKVVVTVERWGDKQRSTQQNSYLWGPMYDKILTFYSANLRALIEDLMSAMKFAITKDFIHSLFKIWFNNGKSTKELSTEGMTKFIDGIREYFFHKHKVDIPPPNTPPIEGL